MLESKGVANLQEAMQCMQWHRLIPKGRVASTAGAGGLVGGNRRMRRAIARGAVRRQPLKRGMLVAPKDAWPRFDGGISMEVAGSTDEGLPSFRYVHSLAYQARMCLPLDAATHCWHAQHQALRTVSW